MTEPNPSTCGDVAVLSRTSAEEFMRELHESHSSAVLAFALGLTRDKLLAEDILQETMIRAWRKMDSLESERTRVRSWLFRVAHNIAIDMFRAKRHRPTEVPEIADDVVPGVVVCHDHSDRILQRERIRQALARLSHQHVVVLEQCYFNDLTAAQAAAVLGIPVGTVKSRLFYGLRALRDLLEQSPLS